MCSIFFKTILLLLLISNPNIFCQNINNTNLNNNTNDDFVYDYESSDNENKTTLVENLESFDDLSGHPNSSNISHNSSVNEEESEEIIEETPETRHNSTSNVMNEYSSTPEDDSSYWDDEEGMSDETCDNEGLLTKMIRIHEENRNITIVKHVKHINDTFDRLNHVRNLYEQYFQPDKRFGTELLAFIGSIDIILTPECFASLFSLISGLRNNKLWANKFMDTMGRPMETGTADGKHSSFGEYDECLDLESPDEKGLVVKGQYCLVKVVVPYPKVNSYKKGEPYDPTFDEKGITPFKYFNGGNFTTIIKMIENLNIYNGSAYRLGLCTPHLCKRGEIEEFINKVLYPIIQLPLELDDYCIRKDKSEDFSNIQIISMAILGLLVVITIKCTGIEIYNILYEKSVAEDNNNLGNTKFPEEEPFEVNPYYYTFSLVTNTRELFTKNNRFSALDTIRLFVILHIYVFDLYNTMATIGIITLKRSYATYPSLVLEYDRYTTLRNTLVFDVIFIMSGFMLSNAILSKLEKNAGKFNFINYVVNRYFRFAAPVLGSMLFFYILPIIGSGPIWNEGTKWVTKGCENPLVVLSGLLFLSNFNEQFGLMERQSACNPSTWLVSALFQLHLLVPIFIIVYYKKPRLGLYLAGGAICIGMLVSIAPTLIWNILPQMQYLKMDSYEQLIQSFSWYHLSTTQYIIGFIVGVIGGYFIRRDTNLPIEYEVIGWVTSVLAIITVYMWSNTFWKTQMSAPLYSVLLWFTFGKLLFSVAITWILYCLCTGRAQTLNYLLSWHNFKPFSRLSFAFFMIHFMVVIRRVFTVKETITMADGLMMENSILDIIYTFCFAFIFYSLIEAPFTNLMTIWLKKEVRDETQMNGNIHKESQNEVKKYSQEFGHFNDIELEEDVNKDIEVENIKI